MTAQERAALVALVAAQQFLDPDVERGPESDGWQNTVTVVRDAIAALSALPSGGAEGPTRELGTITRMGMDMLNRDRQRAGLPLMGLDDVAMLGIECARSALYAEPAKEPTP